MFNKTLGAFALVACSFCAACGPMAPSLPKTLVGQGSGSSQNSSESQALSVSSSGGGELPIQQQQESAPRMPVHTNFYSQRPSFNTDGQGRQSSFAAALRAARVSGVPAHNRIDISRSHELRQIQRSLGRADLAYIISIRDFFRAELSSDTSHGRSDSDHETPRIYVMVALDLEESEIPPAEHWPVAQVVPSSSGSDVINIYFDMPESGNAEIARSLLSAAKRIYIYRTL
jgi:hypothetical protein